MTPERIAELRNRRYDMERVGTVIDECLDEIERLRAALKPFAEIRCTCSDTYTLRGCHEAECVWAWLEEEVKAASKAIEET